MLAWTSNNTTANKMRTPVFLTRERMAQVSLSDHLMWYAQIVRSHKKSLQLSWRICRGLSGAWVQVSQVPGSTYDHSYYSTAQQVSNMNVTFSW
jgi:hypothetical protein